MTRRRWAWALFSIALLGAGCATGGGMTVVASGEPGFYAHTLLQRRCQGCHARPKPEKVSAEKWQAALDRMHKKVRLEAADWDSLAALARRDSTAGALPSHSSAGGSGDALGDDWGNR